MTSFIRTLFVRTEETPNPASLKFVPTEPLMEAGTPPLEFTSPSEGAISPLVSSVFLIPGVSSVFVADTFLTVTKGEDASWASLKPEVFAAVMEFYSSGDPLFRDQAEVDAMAAAGGTAPDPNDSEVVLMIKELLDTRIRPSVQMDGGDIVYAGFEEGIVYLKLKGSCSGCPSSSVTLKHGIENMLMHFIAEVDGVEQIEDEADELSAAQLEKLES